MAATRPLSAVPAPARASERGGASGAGPPLTALLTRLVGDDPPVTVTAYDGTVVGDPEAELRIHVRTPEALSYVLTAPNELGVARAYVTGRIDVDGDVYAVLRAVDDMSLSVADKAALARELAGHARELLRPVPIPVEEAPSRARRVLHGLRHSKLRDSEAISDRKSVV